MFTPPPVIRKIDHALSNQGCPNGRLSVSGWKVDCCSMRTCRCRYILFPHRPGAKHFCQPRWKRDVVDTAGINTEANAADPVLKAAFANTSPGDVDAPDGHQFEDAAGDIFGSADVGGSATQPSGVIWEWKNGASAFTVLASLTPTRVGAEPAPISWMPVETSNGTTQIDGDGKQHRINLGISR